jgi:hypothetical protein
MFSDKFSVQDKYNLITQEYISTCESMPVRFTSLREDRYGPPIDADIKEKLNKWVDYKPDYVADPFDDYDNSLFIEYKDNVILSYFVKKMMRYNIVSSPDNLWNMFLNKIDATELDNLKPTIHNFCRKTGDELTFINGIEYNADGSISGIRIYDSHFDLTGYPYLENIDRLTAQDNTYDNKLADDSITIYLNEDKIKFTLNFFYYSFLERPTPGVFKTKDLYPEQVDMYLDALVNSVNIITQEQSDFIKSKCVNDSHFHLTFVSNTAGEQQDIFFYHTKVLAFEDLTVG